jgi:secreted PhoX family phosphatase
VARREFLKGLAAAAALPAIDEALRPMAVPGDASPFRRFAPIEPSTADDVLVPEGFRYDVVLRWSEPFTKAGETFGYNNDWIGVFALEDDGRALLAVNHEYVSVAFEGDVGVYPEGFRAWRGRAPVLADVKRDVGMSVVRVRRDERTGAWVAVLRDPLNRRIDAFTRCEADGPAARLLGEGPVEGTFDNCSGQTTPWGTALTCEENFQHRVPEASDTAGRGTRGGAFDLPGTHYGWVVEVDPYDPGSTPVKHTALGRFRHENVGLRAEPGKPVAAYMGDDRRGGHLWKFVSDELYRPGDRERRRRLLESGRLYAARFASDGTGEWRLLDLGTALDPAPGSSDRKPVLPAGARTLGDVYQTLGAALIDAYPAANAIGATPSGRPEDVEVHPADGSVYVAFTAESGRPGLFENVFGEIWRIEEDGADVRSARFRWSRFSVGGPTAGGGRAYAQPDNMVFDRRGDLWVATDLGGVARAADPDGRTYGNGGLYRIPVSGPDRGRPQLFASIPADAEAAGPCFAPAEQAVFFSVQHPGERFGVRGTHGPGARGSNWPSRRLNVPPQPALVALRPR